MDRRTSLQLLVMGAAGLWIGNQLDGSSLLEAQTPSPGADSLLPLFPLDLVLLPHTNLPLHIFEERYKEMIQDCLQNKLEFGMLAIQGDTVQSTGCTASMSSALNPSDPVYRASPPALKAWAARVQLTVSEYMKRGLRCPRVAFTPFVTRFSGNRTGLGTSRIPLLCGRNARASSPSLPGIA